MRETQYGEWMWKPALNNMESRCMSTIWRKTSGERERERDRHGNDWLLQADRQRRPDNITLIARHGREEVTVGTMAAKRYAIMGC
jgi:hypothetical protein